MGKTYIVTPDYTTRPPSYPWTHSIAPHLNALAEDNLEVGENDQSVAYPNGNNEDASGQDISTQEHDESSVPERSDTKAIAPPAFVGLMQDVEAIRQSASVSPALYLGDILRDPLADELVALNRKDRKDIPPDDVHAADVKMGFRATRKDLLGGRFGVWATMLSALGLPAGIEAGLSLESRSEDVISARALVTFEFVATHQFVEESMNLASIQSYLAGYNYKAPPPLYMVTGIKVAYGASLQKTSSGQGNGSLGLQIPGADTQKIFEFKKARNKADSFDNSTPFVLAFKVRKVLYKNERWEHRPSKKGVSMMDGTIVTDAAKFEYGGLEEEYVIDGSLIEGFEFARVQDGKDEWILPGHW